MRYLLTVILVLALASPAWSECTANGDAEHADTDNDLNIYGGEYQTVDCSSFDWAWQFYRNTTGGLDPETMTLKIVGTNLSMIFPAATTRSGWHSDNSDKSGRGTVNSSPNELQMLISPDTETVYFEEIDLSASNYQ